uniref:Homeodomain-interacting protein kinase 1-like n=1 Tax=Stegastes partitus TaxID=144197 RepID=A0A3B5AHH1_9TELE
MAGLGSGPLCMNRRACRRQRRAVASLLPGLFSSTACLKPVLYQMATALSHLQSINIIHADVKPVNIMVVNRHQTPLQVKLIDFGVARIGSTVQQGDWMGTLSYSAPEMLLGVPYNECVDMWALGLVMAEVAVGCPLYPGDTDYDVFTSIVQTQGQPPDDEYGRTRWTFKTPDDYKQGFCASDTRKIKLSSLDCIEENMVQDKEHQEDQKMFVSLIKSMLTLDARRRITAREVLKHQFFNSRSPAPNQSATSSQQRVDFSYQSPAPCQSATSWEERVDFSDQSPAPSQQSATSWEERVDFKDQSPGPSLYGYVKSTCNTMLWVSERTKSRLISYYTYYTLTVAHLSVMKKVIFFYFDGQRPLNSFPVAMCFPITLCHVFSYLLPQTPDSTPCCSLSPYLLPFD